MAPLRRRAPLCAVPGPAIVPAGLPPCPSLSLPPPRRRCLPLPAAQVSFGVFETEEDAARQYDRALVLEKVRGSSNCAETKPLLNAF